MASTRKLSLEQCTTIMSIPNISGCKITTDHPLAFNHESLHLEFLTPKAAAAFHSSGCGSNSSIANLHDNAIVILVPRCSRKNNADYSRTASYFSISEIIADIQKYQVSLEEKNKPAATSSASAAHLTTERSPATTQSQASLFFHNDRSPLIDRGDSPANDHANQCTPCCTIM